MIVVIVAITVKATIMTRIAIIVKVNTFLSGRYAM